MRNSACAVWIWGIAAAALLTAGSLQASDKVVKTATEQIVFADGSLQVNRYLLDETTGVWLKMDSDAAGPAATDSLRVEQNVKWPPNVKKISFSFTEYAKTYRKKFKKAMARFINKHRGTPTVPKLKATQNTVSVDEKLPDGQTTGSYQRQFQDDGRNSIVMTDNDRFFLYEAADTVARAWIHSTAIIRDVNGRMEGEMYTDEADIYIKSDFFSLAAPASASPTGFAGDVILTANYRFCLAYLGTAWTDDVLSVVRPYVTSELLYGKDNILWDQSDNRDNLYYNGNWENSPYLAPLQKTVIDIANTNQQGTTPSTFNPFGTPIIVITNLKGFPKSPMELSIYRLVPDTDPQEREFIAKLSGVSVDWEHALGESDKYYIVYWLSLLYIGREAEYELLFNAVRDYGTAETINGVAFNKALPVVFVIKGRLTEKGKAKTIERTYWLVNSKDYY